MKNKSWLVLFLIIPVIQTGMFAQIDTTLADYFPMHIGDVWEYEVELIPPEYYQVRITGDTLMPNGETYFVFKAAGYFNYAEYLRIDDTLRVFRHVRGINVPDSCNEESIVYDLSLPDSTLFIECFREYPEGNFPALLSTFDWYYTYLSLALPTKQFWGAHVDSVTNDTIWGSIFYSENWLAKGIGRTFSRPEAGSPERLVGAIIDSVQYGYVNSIDIITENNLPKDPVILYPNYPNPFNVTTRIEFEVRTRMNLTLTIHNLLGKEIREIYRGITNTGRYDFIWDGKDRHRNQVASGIFYYTVSSEDFAKTRKLILIK